MGKKEFIDCLEKSNEKEWGSYSHLLINGLVRVRETAYFDTERKQCKRLLRVLESKKDEL